MTTDLRYGGISWGDGSLAILYESWYKTRRSIMWTFAPDAEQADATKAVLFDRNYEDSVSHGFFWGTFLGFGGLLKDF